MLLAEHANFKAALSPDAHIEQLANGDLLIEGLASDFGIDRDDEAFEPGAFDRGVKAFMASNPLLAFHHDPSRALGRVLDLRRDHQGLHMKALITKPAAGSWAEDVYQKVKGGVIRGLSVGGRFHRRGKRIFDVDLQEISVTPLPVNPRTFFQVAAEGKAMDGEPLDWQPDRDLAPEEYVRAVEALGETIGALEAATAAGPIRVL